MHRNLIAIAFLTAVTACGHHGTQVTSGKQYLSQYQPVAESTDKVIKSSYQNGEIVETEVATLSTNELVRRAANIEPLLKSPAHIGLVRIDAGRITTVPTAEQISWTVLANKYASLGHFTPLDPFLANYAVKTALPTDGSALRRDASDIITHIRIGAARQHMDAVLIYEVGGRGKPVEGLAPVRVLGNAPLPATPIEREGIARAFLMDVRNGYPYGTASASVDLKDTQRGFWDNAPKDRLGIEAKSRTTQALVPEVDRMLGQLTARLAQTQLASAN